MASYLASAEEDLTCPLCCYLFVDPHTPKQLSCPHTYCQPCIQQLLKKGTKDISCPECRKITCVQDGDIAMIPTNIRLRSLAEKHRKHTEKDANAKSDTTKTSAYKKLKSDGVPLCQTHEGEKLHFYCLTCQVTVCVACLALNHERPQHQVKNVADVHSDKLQIMEVTVKRNEKKVSDLKEQAQHVTDCEEIIKVQLKQSESEIDKAVAMAFAAVEEQAHNLRTTLREGGDFQIKSCEMQKEGLNKRVHDLQAVVNDTKTLLEKGSKHEYLDQHARIAKRFNDLEITHRATIGQDSHNEYGLSRREKDYQDAFSDRKIANSIISFDNKTLCLPSYGYLKSSLVNMGQVAYMQVRKVELCVQNCKFDYVIDKIATGPDGIVAITSSESKSVQVYKKVKDGKTKLKHLFALESSTDDKACGIAVTETGQFMVGRQSCIDVYSASGKHKKNFKLQENVDEVAIVRGEGNSWLIFGANIHVKAILCYRARWDSHGELDINCHTTICTGDTNSSVQPWLIDFMGIPGTSTTQYHSDGAIAISDLVSRVCVYAFNSKGWFGSLEDACFRRDQPKHESVLALFDIPNPTALCYDKVTDSLLIGRKDAEQDAEDEGIVEQYCWRTGRKITCLIEGLKDPRGITFTDDGFLVVVDDKTIRFFRTF